MKVRLGDYIQEYSVKNKDDENISVYSVTNTKGFCKDYFGKEVASKDKTTYKIVPYGYFAYNPSRINVGSVDWQRKEKKVIVSPLYNVFSVSPNLERQYLYYYLKSDFVLQRIKAVATGSVRDNLKLSMLYEFPIELPKLENQRKIVKILDKVSDVIEKKEQELEQLETLVKSRFVELFGDPYVNPLKWKRLKIKDAVTIEPQNGLYKPQSDYVADGTGTPILRIDGFYNGRVTDFGSLKRLKCSGMEQQRYLLLEDDIIINRVNSIEYLGKCAHIKGLLEDTVYESNMMRMHFDPEHYNPVYICKLLCSQYIYDQIVNHAKKAVNQASINQKDVLDFNIYQPPLELQNQFADFVVSVDKSKSKIQKSLEETQLLFDSLMQKYFG